MLGETVYSKPTDQVEVEFLKTKDAVVVHDCLNQGIVNGRRVVVEYI